METQERDIISVIVCTCNSARTIERALRSVVGQRCRWAVEVEVGDDASADGTADIVRRFARQHPQVRLTVNETRLGVAANYFATLRRCRGRYVADLAGDDEWATADKLQRELDVMEGDATLALVHSDYSERDARSGALRPMPYARQGVTERGAAMAEAVLSQRRRPAVHLCTALYRRRAALRVMARWPQFFSGAEPCEDLQLTALIGFVGGVGHLPLNTLYYTVGAPSASRTLDYRRLYRFDFGCARLAFALRRELGMASRRVAAQERERIFVLLMHTLRLGDAARRRATLALAREWGVGLSPAARLVRAVTSTRLTWQAALLLRRLVLKLRHRPCTSAIL